MYSGPAVQTYTGEEYAWKQGVERPKIPICQKARDEATEETNSVHHAKNVDCGSAARGQNLLGPVPDVVEGEVEAPKAKKHADAEKQVCGLAEGGELEDGASLAGWEARFEEEDCHAGCGEHDEAYHSHCPAEAEFGEEVRCDGWTTSGQLCACVEEY